MSETKIFLKEIDDVKEFVNIVMLVSYDVDLVSGRYAVDAKSIMGIFSLDLSEPVLLKAHTDDADDLFKKLDEKGFIVK